MFSHDWTTLDYLLLILGVSLLGSLIAIIWKYAKGLSRSPRELWILFLIKCVENSVYSSVTLIITLWLSKDCGLDDIEASNAVAVYGVVLSVMAMLSGALVDAIGVKRTLIFGTTILLLSRMTSFWVKDPYVLYLTFLAPMAIGFAVMNPVISVGIKRLTTKSGAALGFGLFYIFMNLTVAIGGKLTDTARSVFAERAPDGKVINENMGHTFELLGQSFHLSTYQIILLVAFLSTPLTMLLVFSMRGGVHVENDKVVTADKAAEADAAIADDGGQYVRRNPLAALSQAVGDAAQKTLAMMRSVVSEQIFWRFMLILAIVVFTRLIFQHFHYTFPKYGIRLLGEGAPIGQLYSVLNPMIIVFLVPVVAWLTKSVNSYLMLIWGTLISSLSCFIAYIPASFFKGWSDTMLGEAVFVRWLGICADRSDLAASAETLAVYWPLLCFIAVFTVGEAFWSPRLMQFTTEIAPKGKEGTYLALSILPWFLAKTGAASISGVLLKDYIPEVGEHPDHAMIWVIVGCMALVTPLGLLVFRKMIPEHHNHDEDNEQKKEAVN